ncbi:MAG: TonB-dependent receptor [Acidobacteria bacterium]|nr:TonB-dependent receptor [Acidobacteriota bacterium]
MKRHRRLVFLMALGILAAVVPQRIGTAWAQTVTGTIIGTVTDQTGALVPNVSVKVTNTATTLSRTVTTNEAGQYTVPFLPPGVYTVACEQSGFRRQEVGSVIVEIEQRVRVDLQLTVGEITETVHVESAGPLLNTESSSIGQVIDNRRVVDLPLNGRQFLELSFLVPATHASAPGHFNAFLQGIAVTSAGGRPTNNNFTLDGIDNNSPNCGYFSISPSVDAVQEFKIQTSNYSAEFGRTGGAIINVATKSGTNELHGSLFEFLRNDVFDARNFFNTRDRDGDGKADAEQLRRNQFGGSVGGPVFIPGLYNGKGRTFFFYNQEHLKERKATVNVGRVPSGSVLSGDFSSAGYTIYDPQTTRPNPNFDPSRPAGATNLQFLRDPFPGNRIPDGRISPVSKKALAFYPQPNNAGDPLRNFINSEPFRRDNVQINTRGDHQISPNDNFFARYSQNNLTANTPRTLPGFDFDIRFRGINTALNWVHTLSPSLVNEVRAGYNRLNFSIASPRQGTDFSKELGIQGIPFTSLSGFPIFGIGGFSSLGDFEPYGNIDNIYQAVDMASFTKGTHSMKGGVDIRRVQNDYYIARAPSGSYGLSGQYTGLAGIPLQDGLADFLLGLPSSNVITYLGDVGRTRTTNYNLFFQDDWKVSPKLTVNLGVRYELYTAPIDKFGRQGYMDPATGELVYARDAPLNDPIPGAGITEADLKFPHRKVDRESLFIGDKNNVAPRIGFAYELARNTVLRGGYGISYVYFPFSDIGVNSQRLLPFAIVPSLTGGAFVPTIPNFNFDVGGARQVLLAGNPFAVAGVDPNVKWGDVQQWSLNLQHELRGNVLVDVGYIGNKASHLAQRYPTNVPFRPEAGAVQARRPFPGLAGVTQVQSDINNFYGAMTVRIEKRFSHGFSFLTSYTWAKSLGYGSEVYGTPGQESGAQDPRNFKIERGLAPDDVRQRLSISGIWELPFGKGRRFLGSASGAANVLLGGWQVNTITAFQTGFHTTATGGAFLNMGTASRPDQIGNPNRDFQFSVNQAFNTKAFARPAQFRFGTAPRGSIETPGIRNVDLSVVKNTQLVERLNMQFRFEMFNMANHPNFGLPNRNFDSAGFGQVTSASDPRLIQFGLKFLF